MSVYQIYIYVSLAAVLFSSAAFDFKQRRIPNSIIIGGFILWIISNAFYAQQQNIADSALGAASAAIVLGLMYVITRGGIGIGDIKLFSCVGLFIGIQGTLSALLLSSLMSGLTGLILMKIKKIDKSFKLPFAPFILIGVITVLVIS